jgi:hypothetical protein
MSPEELEERIDKCLTELVKQKLKEISSTGGEGYTGKYAYNPNKNASGTAHNYYLKLGWKLVNRKKT